VLSTLRPSLPYPTRRLHRWLLSAVLALALSLCSLLILDHLFPPNLHRLHDLSVTITDRDGQPLRIFTNAEDKWRLPVRTGEVSDLYLQMLQAYEDSRFAWHPGVDPIALGRAVIQNLSAGRIVSGASTLTMQVARLLEPRPRTVGAKLIEMVRALQLEWRYDKRTILEMYLTLAPFGGNVEGVTAAARILFGKRPAFLAPAEAALLVALPQAPSNLRPDRAPDRAREARNKVLERVATAGVIGAETLAEAKTVPVPDRWRPMPAHAAHLSRRFVATARQSPSASMATSLDGGLQIALETLAQQEAMSLHPRANLALLVVDNGNRAVRAYVGSADFLDDRRFGAIDLVRTVRSPGSTLKPFIYGLAFEDHVVGPGTLVADVSTRFGSYAPGNFDQSFHGELTVAEALQQSLNVPAVLLLDRVGPIRFAKALTDAGARLVLPPGIDKPGLPLALGGVGMSLWDLVTIYTGLANGGSARPLRAVPQAATGESAADDTRFLDPDAAWQVLRTLEQAPPAEGLATTTGRRPRLHLALKTGTSYGFRDAWAVGVTRGYTVGVWSGRPDGTPVPGRYGRNTAAPIVYRVFDHLPQQGLESAVPPGAVPDAHALTTDPPSALRTLPSVRAADARIALTDREALRLVFPTPGIALSLSQEDGGFRPLVMVARGGVRPLTWLVDGRPIARTDRRRKTAWHPTAPGFARITVIDAAGRSAAADVRIE